MSNTESRPRTIVHSPSPIMSTSLASLSSYQRQQHHLEQRHHQTGTHLRPISSVTTATSELDDDDDDHSSLSSISQRGSTMVASVVGLAQLQQQQQLQRQHQQQQQASKSAQAFQVTRVKPQIMRVNTVRVMDEEGGSVGSPNGGGGGGLSRSGSVRTVLTRDNSISSNLSRSNTAPSRRPFSNSTMNHQRTTMYSTSSTISPESSPTTATAFRPSLLPLPPSSPKRTSAPILLSAGTAISSGNTESDPFHDRHSVIEDEDDDDDDPPGISEQQPNATK